MGDHAVTGPDGHLRCPFCWSYHVVRLYVVPLDMDTCDCRGCDARWDENRGSGVYRGQGRPSSVIAQRAS